MLNEEIDNAQRLVKTDAYQLSIGEVVNMYRSGEFVVNPDFQRLFRWEIGQKAKLIESLLLGIPIPSIFVFERENSTWELIDGLQRISTILEFMGQLIDPATGHLKPPTAMVGTKYLPSLDNVVWEPSEQVPGVPFAEQVALPPPLQLAIRRSRISVEILKRPSDNATKYDLFQRLNAGGTTANAQELRNCIIIMVSAPYGRFVRDLASYQPFLTALATSEDQLERFLVHTYIDYDGKLDVEEFIDESIVTLATAAETRIAGQTFRGTFDLLNDAYGDNAFRRFTNGQPGGRVVLVAFECIAIGIARNIATVMAKANRTEWVRDRIRQLWESPEIAGFFPAGLRGTIRIQRTIPFGIRWFAG
ncbi:MAG: DUF262 domain-containing protein [Xanthobacteraceae bacterium]